MGRDLLIGGVLGIVWDMLLNVALLAPDWFGLPVPMPYATPSDSMLDRPIAILLLYLVLGVGIGLSWCLMLFLAVLILRKEWLAAGLAAVLVALSQISFFGWSPFTIAAGGLIALAILFVFMRFGLLALVVGFIVAGVLADVPFTFDFTAWYASSSACILLALAAMFAYAFLISLGNRPLLGKGFFPDE